MEQFSGTFYFTIIEAKRLDCCGHKLSDMRLTNVSEAHCPAYFVVREQS